METNEIMVMMFPFVYKYHEMISRAVWENLLIAFTLTLLAGLATGIGGAIAFFTKRTNARFLSVALGFSAGVMIYVSFTVLQKARSSLVAVLGEQTGNWDTIIAFRRYVSYCHH